MKCWGSNFDGELGNGTRINFLTPKEVNDLVDGTGLALGGSPYYPHGFTYATLVDHTIKCWGWNRYGQLGNGNKGYSATAVKVNGLL